MSHSNTEIIKKRICLRARQDPLVTETASIAKSAAKPEYCDVTKRSYNNNKIKINNMTDTLYQKHKIMATTQLPGTKKLAKNLVCMQIHFYRKKNNLIFGK